MWLIIVIGKCNERIPPCSSPLMETGSDVIVKTMVFWWIASVFAMFRYKRCHCKPAERGTKSE